MRRWARVEFSPSCQGVRCYVDGGNLVVESSRPLKALSSALLNGGLRRARSILNHQVPSDFNEPNPAAYLEQVAHSLQLPRPVVGLMTAAAVNKASHRGLECGAIAVDVFVTAGLSNAVSILDSVDVKAVGTVNIILLVDGAVEDPCLVELVRVVAEAKAEAFRRLDVRSRASGRPATCTSTDSIVVACTRRGERVAYAGLATELGRLVSLGVLEGVKEAVVKHEGLLPIRPLIKRLEERGITFDDLVDAALEPLVYHPDMGSREEVVEVLRECLLEALEDINVASLVLAGLRLQEDGEEGLIPGLTAEAFKEDPVSLLADEILGMEIAKYIAGTKGLFEFVRFDKAKPGVLKRLGPFMDDVIGGLIAGSSSNMYSRLLAKRRSRKP
ncbi:MAG: hypothetical protein DRJ97_05470 [Thermoprotei archaeon]|nr:MAG: hypothetical protein DRJ97_05470 [Thermoprotei archaeon]